MHSFLVCFLVTYVNALVESYEVEGQVFFAVFFMLNALHPLQGFFNVMVDIRQRYLSMRSASPEDGRLTSLKRTILESDPRTG